VAELILFPGTPVEIERIGQTRYTEERFHGRIQVVDVSRLIIILPAPLLRLLSFDVGQEIQLKASLPEGMFRFSGKILEKGERGFTMPYPFAITNLQRRQQRRVLVDGIAIFAVRETASARPNFGTLIDVSIGGLQVQAEKWMPVGTNLDVEFSLQDGLRGAARSVIMWKKDAQINSAEVRTFCYGLKFVQIDEQMRRQIANYIRERERSLLGSMTEAEVPA
jgi:c-di-GMP-binding flagellar brake protein YcgR